MKVVLRGAWIETSFGARRQLERDIQCQEKELGNIEVELSTTLGRLPDWRTVWTELLNTCCWLEKHTYMAYRQWLHAEGNKTGSMLARLVWSERLVSLVLSMRSRAGKLVCTQRLINRVFSDHLREAYIEHLCPSLGDQGDFLVDVPLPSLAPGIREALEDMLTREEVIATIRRFKTAKTPGSNGLPWTSTNGLRQ
ncbi:hypothetical protein NDU88_001676 [Pleurodeles waltl]|uniref:Uncharacterized protein n=1 Tax=Pleurodeles waltl TaxID=8319 RepID=A0AAV7UV05_PLEWA|nr:hypothetical protein NDU88_001676 [Pleurodeles waltl]